MANPGTSGPAQDHPVVLTQGDEAYGMWYRQLYRALKEFVGPSLALVLVFLILGVLVYILERSAAGWLQPVRDALSRHLFHSYEVTGSFLDTVAGGFLTMTSIIVTMLLLVLQQTASNMGNLIFDQFLARRRNQLYAGLIVGTLVLALLVRATVNDAFNPVLGATTVLVVSIMSIVLLVAFLYTTIEQMRPETIIREIHRATLAARRNQLALIQRTRRKPVRAEGSVVELRTGADGYLIKLDFDRLSDLLAGAGPDVEVLLVATPGTYVSYYDLLAQVRATGLETARETAERVGRAFRFASMRDMTQDPAYGLEQLEMLAWTEISSAKHNPEVGLRAIHSLRDLLSRWLLQGVEVEAAEPLPLVFPDGLLPTAMDTLESLGVVALESQQHQVLAEVLRTVDVLFDRFSAELRERAEELVLRLLPQLDGQVVSHELDLALFQVGSRISSLGDQEAAEVVHEAREQQANTIDFVGMSTETGKERALKPARGPGFKGDRS